jgi:hypothetical protein
MQVLLFDEKASETNNNFHIGFNTTIRRGHKYATLEIGTIFRLENLKGMLLGYGKVEQLVVGPIDCIPYQILDFEHDPKCRKVSGLIEVLQNCYDDTSIDTREIVTAIVFRTDYWKDK